MGIPQQEQHPKEELINSSPPQTPRASSPGLDEVRAILSACGKSAVLGPLEDNEEEDDEEEGDEEDEQSGKGGAMLAALEQAMSGLAVAH